MFLIVTTNDKVLPVSSRYYITPEITIFKFYFSFSLKLWLPNFGTGRKFTNIKNLKNKALKIIHLGILNHLNYFQSKIQKRFDKVTFQNCIFVKDQMSKNLSTSFHNYFNVTANQHTVNDRISPRGLI